MGAAAACVGGVLAFPADAEVTVGGFMTQTVGFGDYKDGDEAKESVHFDTNAEMLFTATGQTDGGLTITARVELEGHSGGDQIDENWLSIEGGFGKITLGGEDPAVITHGYAGIAGGYGTMGYYDDTDSFTPIGATIYPVGYKDGQGIRYSAPSFGGFSVGVSYQPEFDDGPRSSSKGNDDRALSIGAGFSNETITIAGGVLTFDESGTGDGRQFGLGAEFNIGETTFFLRTDQMKDLHKNSDMDVEMYGVAVEHKVGSLTIGLGYAQRKEEFSGPVTIAGLIEDGELDEMDDEAVIDRFGRNAQASDYEGTGKAVVLGTKYDLGGGVDLGAAVAWGKIEGGMNLVSNSEDVRAMNDLDGTGFGAYLAFSF